MDHNMNKSRDSPKEFGVLGREVLGEECSLNDLEKGGEETFEG